jgi:hypothetical protein
MQGRCSWCFGTFGPAWAAFGTRTIGPVAIGPLATPGTELGSGALPRLSSERCCCLLARASWGHLALSQGALPLVVPVASAVDGDRLLVRAGIGLLGRVARHPGVVAFETSATSPDGTWRWEVLVQGHAEVLPEKPGAKVPPKLPLVDSALTTALCITMELVTGWQYGSPPTALLCSAQEP